MDLQCERVKQIINLVLVVEVVDTTKTHKYDKLILNMRGLLLLLVDSKSTNENKINDNLQVQMDIILSLCLDFSKLFNDLSLNHRIGTQHASALSACSVFNPQSFFEQLHTTSKLISAIRNNCTKEEIIIWHFSEALLQLFSNHRDLLAYQDLTSTLLLLITFTLMKLNMVQSLLVDIEYRTSLEANKKLFAYKNCLSESYTAFVLENYIANNNTEKGYFVYTITASGPATRPAQRVGMVTLLNETLDLILLSVQGVLIVGGEKDAEGLRDMNIYHELWVPVSVPKKQSPPDGNSVVRPAALLGVGGGTARTEVMVAGEEDKSISMSHINLVPLMAPLTDHSVVQLQPNEAVSSSSADIASQHDYTPIRVLLMEDSVLVQKIICRLLHQRGCEVRIAKNGRVGLEMLQNEEFDLALIDFVMPIQDGVTTMRLFKHWMDEMRSRPEYRVGNVVNDQILLIGISDAATEEDKTSASYNDMHLFCEKPINTQILDIVLNAHRTCSSYHEVLVRIEADRNKLLHSGNSLMKLIEKFAVGGLGKVSAGASASNTAVGVSAVRAKSRRKANPPPPPKPSWWGVMSSLASPFITHAANNPPHSSGAQQQQQLPDPPSMHMTASALKDKAQRSNKTPAAASDPLEGVSVRVLVVEDQPTVQKILHRILSQYNCEVKVARNGRIGVECMRGEAWDVVLVDFNMPVCDGLETFREIQETLRTPGLGLGLGGNTLLIGMSEGTSPEEKVAAFSYSMHMYCCKPIKTSVLHCIIDAVRAHSGLGDRLRAIEAAVARMDISIGPEFRKG